VSEAGGLINHTYLLGHPPQFVVQRVNPIFAPSVHEDIEAVTAWLQRCGLPTPRLLRTDQGTLYHIAEDQSVWRAMNFLPGQSFQRVPHPQLAKEAGRLVAGFHQAMASFDWDYRHVRLGVHDTPRHMARLQAVVGPSAPLPGAQDVADRILAAWQQWEGPPASAPMHAHGDLKISNLRFDTEGRGLCLLDLDTLGKMPLEVELGDALRSWCNPVGEDSVDTYIDSDIFSAALAGYHEIRPLTAEQRDAIAGGVEHIALELASRFCRDVWEDNYFGWNANRFPSRAAHNLYRARGQLQLALSMRQARDAGKV
jgi:Ser/Thr protein kinase RdoA (MazF antagonist)